MTFSIYFNFVQIRLWVQTWRVLPGIETKVSPTNKLVHLLDRNIQVRTKQQQQQQQNIARWREEYRERAKGSGSKVKMLLRSGLIFRKSYVCCVNKCDLARVFNNKTHQKNAKNWNGIELNLSEQKEWMRGRWGREWVRVWKNRIC